MTRIIAENRATNRKHWLGQALSLTLLVLLLVCGANSSWGQATPLHIGQTAIDGTSTGTGYVDVTANPSPPYFSSSDTQGYLNVVATIEPFKAATWVVQNLRIPLHTGFSGDFGLSTPGTFSVTFNLGSNSLSGAHNVCASFTATPYSGGSGNFTCVTVIATTQDVGSLLDGAINGDKDGGLAFAGSHHKARNNLKAALPQKSGAKPVHAMVRGPLQRRAQVDGVIEHVRLDVPGIQQGNMECGPVSAAQSFQWLAKRNELGGAKLPAQDDLIAELKTDMKWDNSDPGINAGDFQPGAQKFTDDHKLPLTTESIGSKNGDGTGVFDWIKKQIEAGQDVEVRLQPTWKGGHWVTVSGWGDDGKTQTLFVTDPATGGKAVDSYQLDATGKKLSLFKWNPKPGAAILSMAVAQSPTKKVSYDNGPVNGATDAWTINFGYVVSDTFTFSADAVPDTFTFWAWLSPGDILQSATLSISSQANGGTSYFNNLVNFSQSDCFVNSFGFNVCLETASFTGPDMNAGTYWVNLANATVASGNAAFWDENSGVGCGGSDGQGADCPSLAWENTVGTIASEAFSISGTPIDGPSRPFMRQHPKPSGPAQPYGPLVQPENPNVGPTALSQPR